MRFPRGFLCRVVCAFSLSLACAASAESEAKDALRHAQRLSFLDPTAALTLYQEQHDTEAANAYPWHWEEVRLVSRVLLGYAVEETQALLKSVRAVIHTGLPQLNARYANLVGIWAKRMEDYPLAESAYLCAQALNPEVKGENIGVLNNLGSIMRLKGDYEMALNYYDRSIALLEEQKVGRFRASYIANKALVYMEIGDYAKAETLLIRAMSLAPDNGEQSKMFKWGTLLLANYLFSDKPAHFAALYPQVKRMADKRKPVYTQFTWLDIARDPQSEISASSWWQFTQEYLAEKRPFYRFLARKFAHRVGMSLPVIAPKAGPQQQAAAREFRAHFDVCPAFTSKSAGHKKKV